MYDFEKVNLTIKECYKLFVTHIRGRVKKSFFGNSVDYLTEIDFIRENHYDKTDSIGNLISTGTYSVTNNYRRYLVFRREKFFLRVLDSFLTPIIVSIITSILTVIILNKLGLG